MRTDPQDSLRAIPSVDSAVRHIEAAGIAGDCPRPILVRTVRDTLARVRGKIAAGTFESAPDADVRRVILREVENDVGLARRKALLPVINGTGVVVHTNLGRAPLSKAALESVAEIASGYSNLEYDLGRGERGTRDYVVRDALCELTGAEDALVVNNNAAAVLLALDTLAKGREVLVSRSELIEVGGSFRLPDVFEKSGATLVEVGTTNRTRVEDFERALRSETGALMSAHWSNYTITGFVERVALADLAHLGATRGIPVIHDLGSGMLVAGGDVGLGGEMTAAESVRTGVSLSTMSGDKLLGGPQAGIALGRAPVISRMRRNPLARALRPCKLTLAALEATLAHYLRGTALTEIPILRMLTADSASLEMRARDVVASVSRRCGITLEVVDVESRIGGGAAPERVVPSRGIAVVAAGSSADAVAARMLSAARPIVARTTGDRVLVDMRTVLPEEDDALSTGISEALTGHEARS